MREAAGATHDALLDAAECLFARQGYASVGIREIAEHAGANIASIKYHFGSKRELYLATVRRVMARGRDEGPWALLDAAPRDAGAAAIVLAKFVRDYVRRIWCDESGRPCGRLMLWEAVQPTEAIDDVVGDFIRPAQARLADLVANLIPAGDTAADGTRCARSILGQILHEHTYRAIVERLERADGPLDRAAHADRTARHITWFSLRALGHDEAFIARAVAAAGPSPGHDRNHAAESGARPRRGITEGVTTP